jgi:Na+/melibiose symporter-like transporter
MLLAFALAVLIQLHAIQLWHVYVIGTLLGLVTALDLPSQQAFLGDLAGLSEVRRAVNLNAIIVQISRMIGPALAGIIIGVLGSALAFWLNGVSFVPVIASLIVVRAREAQARHEVHASALHEFSDGLRALGRQARLQKLIAMVVLVTFLVFPIVSIMPAFVGETLHGDAQTLGIILGASGAGALIGSAIITPLMQAARRVGLALVTAVLWMGFWFLVFASSSQLWLAALSMFLASVAFPLVFATALGLVQVIASPEMRARQLGLFVTVSFGTQPIASLLAGLSAQLLTTAVAIQLNGALLVAGAAIFAARTSFRKWQVATAQNNR